MTSYKKVFHTTKMGFKSMIKSDGWVVSNNSPHCAFYGRGIYFWELESDAHRLGKFWYGRNNYEIVSENLPFLNNFLVINRDIPQVRNPDAFARSFLSKGINILIIPRAYLNHKAQIESSGFSCVWLVDLPPSGIAKIKLGFQVIE